MYSILPSFILGFHGCDESVAEAVFSGKHHLNPSQNHYDWLGEGIYFWENSPARAMEYAILRQEHPVRKSHPKVHRPAVVGAIIDLGYCLNLLDAKFLQMVKDEFVRLHAAAKEAGIELPKNRPLGKSGELLLRDLDCAVINKLHNTRKRENLRAIDTVRSAFIEGQPLYEGSEFSDRNHIQICVRNVGCIKGYFRPLAEVDGVSQR